MTGIIAWSAFLTKNLMETKKYHNILLGGLEQGDVAKTISNFIDEVRNLNLRTDEMQIQINNIDILAKSSLHKVGSVRFDAFSDIGGELSYSLALLNNDGDGVVITSINGRSESRTYSKTVRSGKSDYTLSEEEKKAITAAMVGKNRK